MEENSFQEVMYNLYEHHKASKKSFFNSLRNYPTNIFRSTELLNELYKRYQAAMHATRVMAYYMPYLDSIDLRMVKLKVLADDDGAPNGDSHHYQLRRLWTQLLGELPKMQDEDFGDLNDLKLNLDPATAEFVSLTQRFYPLSLGPWIMIEGLAHDWIGALLGGLSVHFPDVGDTDYFIYNYFNNIEITHAEEAIETTKKVLFKRPDLINSTIEGAKKIGGGLDIFWDGLDLLLTSYS